MPLLSAGQTHLLRGLFTISPDIDLLSGPPLYVANTRQGAFQPGTIAREDSYKSMVISADTLLPPELVGRPQPRHIAAVPMKLDHSP